MTLLALAAIALGAAAQDPTAAPAEARRWAAPATLPEWEREAEALRQRILIGAGLWPRLPKSPLEPAVFGRAERDGFTVEKVFFASLPGHYVSGSLFRPFPPRERAPAVLCPLGHRGRMHDAGTEEAQRRIAAGFEEHEGAARQPQLAQMAHLARMGCVVFGFDLVGCGSSTGIEHGAGFGSIDAVLQLQSALGLQLWNAIRALDFVLSLPGVDPERIGVAAAGADSAQALLLCAIDPRPVAAFAAPASDGTHDRCACESTPYLSFDAYEVALAALFAPKPLALAGASGWTADLKRVYGLYDCAELVRTQAPEPNAHGWHRRARELLYASFARALDLGAGAPLRERAFEPLGAAELEVFDAEHPRPTDAASADAVRAHWTAAREAQLAALLPPDAEGIADYQSVVGAAARLLLDADRDPDAIVVDPPQARALGGSEGAQRIETRIGCAGTEARIPLLVLRPEPFRGRAVLWIDGAGAQHLLDGERPTDAARAILDAGFAVGAIDPFGTGPLAQRVRDIGTARAALPRLLGELRSLHLAGTDGAGPAVLLARAVAGESVARTYADLRAFGFAKIDRRDDADLLPGALAYGGLGGLAALAAPATLFLAGVDGAPAGELAPLVRAQQITGGTVETAPGARSAAEIVAWLLQ